MIVDSISFIFTVYERGSLQSCYSKLIMISNDRFRVVGVAILLIDM